MKRLIVVFLLAASLFGVMFVGAQTAYRTGIVCALANVNIRRNPSLTAPLQGVGAQAQAKRGECYRLVWVVTPNPTQTLTQRVDVWYLIEAITPNAITRMNSGWVAGNIGATPLAIVTSFPVLYSPTPTKTVSPTVTRTSTIVAAPTRTTSPTQAATDIVVATSSAPQIQPSPTCYRVLGITHEPNRIITLTGQC